MLSRISFGSLRRVLLITTGLVAALFLGPPTSVAQASAPTVQVPDTVDAVVQVRGMACSGCAQRMKSALEEVEGVERATVLLDEQEVLLMLTDETVPSKKALQETVTTAGYEFRTAVFADGRTDEGEGG